MCIRDRLCQRVKLKPGDEDYASRTSTGALIHRSSRGNWPGTGGWLQPGAVGGGQRGPACRREAKIRNNGLMFTCAHNNKNSFV